MTANLDRKLTMQRDRNQREGAEEKSVPIRRTFGSARFGDTPLEDVIVKTEQRKIKKEENRRCELREGAQQG